jgi:hypothetical protein
MPDTMLPFVKYQALCDFGALPTIRKICASRGAGLVLSDVSVLTGDILQESKNLPRVSFNK